VPLASNQVQYSLLYREPERNGVADAVREAGATLIAYSPLNQGLLTGALSQTLTCISKSTRSRIRDAGGGRNAHRLQPAQPGPADR